ncbi:MAG: hypothetical protein ACLQBL_29270 [Polyangiaceae bacterium]|jgi:hypothetical protein
MHRSSSVLLLGLFAASAALQAAAACSNNPTAPNGQDSGPPVVGEDSGADVQVPPSQESCFGPLPVMTVTGPDGGQVAPDWSCYDAGAAFLFRHAEFHPDPMDTDAGDDAGDAGDAAVDAADSASPVDASPPVDSSVPPDGSTTTDAGANTYVLHLTDFVSNAPAAGATVSLFWGPSSLAPIAFTGLVDDAGLMFFPPPPAGEQIFTYHVYPDAGQASFYWLAAVLVAPPGQTNYNSITTASDTELLTSVLGSESANAQLATLVTGADDCEDHDVRGAQFQIVYASSGQPVPTGTTPGQARTFYLQNNLPNAQCTFTTNQGGRSVWSMINGPVDTTGQYKIQLIGRMTESQTTPAVLAEYPVESYPGTTTVLRSGRFNTSPPN